jgi:hypothetical protein
VTLTTEICSTNSLRGESLLLVNLFWTAVKHPVKVRGRPSATASGAKLVVDKEREPKRTVFGRIPWVGPNEYLDRSAGPARDGRSPAIQRWGYVTQLAM